MLKFLPKDIGNEDGEPIIPERQIRIMDKPMMASMSMLLIRYRNLSFHFHTPKINRISNLVCMSVSLLVNNLNIHHDFRTAQDEDLLIDELKCKNVYDRKGQGHRSMSNLP